MNSPEWLILLPVLALLAWRWPRLGLRRPLRLLACLVAIFLLADPMLSSRRGGMDLWVLLDRSTSTGDTVDKGLAEWHSLLNSSRQSHRDKLHFLDFAADVSEHAPGAETLLLARDRGQSRLAFAIQHAIAAQSPDRPARVLAFTDGFSTEPLRDAATKLAAQGIPLDFRLIQEPPTEDARITSFDINPRVQPGEAFLIRISLSGSIGSQIPVKIRRNGQSAGESVATLENGRASIELVDRLSGSGSHFYEAEILPQGDTIRGNNTASAWVDVTGGPRVLLLTPYKDDPMAAAFRAQGLEVFIPENPKDVTSATLSGARAVVINNIPAHELDGGFLHALDFYVREQGGGLLMAGGKNSFGSGGYFSSPVDPLLPVSMELKADHRKLAVAMAIVMDRSGSMSVNVPGPGGANVTKMDLANNGAVTATDLLGWSDSICVFAVDSEPHRIVPMTTVGENKAGIVSKIRKVKSTGGGIFVYKGLEAARNELRRSPEGTRHVILFSDAADSEEPGDYKRLLTEMTNDGMTVSVIGLGTRQDSDADLLDDIAKRGKGRIFFTADAAEIPRLFAQETVTIARSAFITEPVAAKATGDWSVLSSQPLAWLGEVDGYNLSYARPESTVSLVSGDEYLAPLVATMRRGLGRTAAVSFPLAGDFSTQIRAWPAYADFTKTLARWLAGPTVPAGLGFTHTLEGNRLSFHLNYVNREWSERLAIDAPLLKLAIGSESPTIVDVPWQRLSPGHLSGSVDLAENQMVRGVLQVGDHTLPFGPLQSGISAEWSFDPDRLADLKSASTMTGGREILNLSDVWLRPPVIQRTDLRIPLTVLLLCLVLADAFITRINWSFSALSSLKFPHWSREPRTKHAKAPARADVKKAAVPSPQSDPKPAPPTKTEDVSASTSETQRKSRFARAKKS